MKTKLRSFVLSLAALLLALPAAAQVPDQLYYSIPAPPTGPQTYAQLGFSVAVEGSFAVVGAPFDDTGGEDSGLVRVFDSATGAPLFLLPNPSPAGGDNFGYSVAISGTRIVVGARLDDTGATDSGSAYVYDLSSGTPTVPVLTLSNPFPGNDDEFGNSVAISGTRIVVGASLDNTGATDTGSAYVYDLSSGTPTMPVFTLNNPEPAVFDLFGHSVAISGTRVVVGAIFDDAGEIDAGSAYVYDLGSGTPTVPVFTLNNPGPALDDRFGVSVAISGTRVVVGAILDETGAPDAGSAYVYDLSSGTPTVPMATLNNPSPALNDYFGNSVAISGTRVVVGARLDDTGASDAGSAYVFDLSSGTPTVPVATLHNPTPAASDRFGYAVAISGTRVVVGADFHGGGAGIAGSAYLYDLSRSTPTVPLTTMSNPSPAANDWFGYAVAISGTRMVVGAIGDSTGGPNAGSAYVYDLSSGTPAVPVLTLTNPSPAGNDWFGYSVAISGTRVVVGAPYDDTGASEAGSAYVYDLSSGTPMVPVATLNKPSPADFDYFGEAVAISGTRVVVGAPRDDTGATDAGSAYVYDLSSGTPTIPVATLNNPSPAAGDEFGRSVTISDTRVVVGVPYDDTGAQNAGSAYVYDLSSGSPTVPVFTLNNPSPALLDVFGIAVAVSGTRVVVGAIGDNTGAPAAGSAYVYDLSSGSPTVPVTTLNNPNPADSDYFGSSVAISGTQVVVGAVYDDTGAGDAGSAYLYDLTSGTPTVPVATLNNPGPAEDDRFGVSVAISGNLMVVGANLDDTGAQESGSAYVYDLSGGSPTVPVAALSNPAPGDNFGYSVAISGTRMVVGAIYGSTGTSYSGNAYVYDLSSGIPTVPAFTLNNPSPTSGGGFATSVAISGTRVVVGAFFDDTGAVSAGSAYVYDLSSGTPMVPVATLNNPDPAQDDYFGYSVAISGTRVVVGAYGDSTGASGAGSAYVYDLSSGTPTVPVAALNNPTPANGDHFGNSVAISGTRVVVGALGDNTGANDAGGAYVYDLSSGTPTVPVVTLNNPGPAQYDYFGSSVAISGTRVVVGASNAGIIYSGNAYVFDLSSGTPTGPVATLNNPSPAVFDRFGYAVAISGTRVVVGAYGDHTGAGNAGSAYVYDLSNGTPAMPVATLNNPTPAVGDGFGYSVAIDGTTVAIGTPYDDTIDQDKGSAYVFGPSPYSLWKVTDAGDQFAPDLGDADSDGLTNLGEYGLLRSPTIPNGAATTAAPAVYAEGRRLRMFVPRDPARYDVTLEVQATGDLLGSWTTIATSTFGAPFTGPGYFAGDSATPGVKQVEVRDIVNLPDAPRRFLRVRVTH